MTLDYLHIPVAILKLPDLNLRQKLLLGLIVSFNEKGLVLGNERIGELLGISACRVSHILAGLEKLGYIRIENRQSKFRKIYFVANSKVAVLLCRKQQSKNDSTLSFPQGTLLQIANITKVTKHKRA